MVKFEKNSILWQILLWWGSWILISFILTNGQGNFQLFATRSVVVLFGIAIVVAVNLKALLPNLYFRKQKGWFVIAGLLLIVLIGILIFNEAFPWSEWMNSRPGTNPALPREGSVGGRDEGFQGMRWVGRMTPLAVAFLGSTLVKVSQFANQKEKEAIRSEKERLETELKFLKSQVNPHFLFNALNNIYSLAVVQAPQTPESVMQLSEILRYMVYDSNAEKVPLKSEISYIENYVNLKLLKDSRGMDVTLDLDEPPIGLMVAPLLFIPFVENAFKHSKIEDLGSGFIKINMKTKADQVEFRVVNSLQENGFAKDKVGGVGLENIKKRLDLLYPEGQHELKINRSKDQFEIYLKLSVQ